MKRRRLRFEMLERRVVLAASLGGGFDDIAIDTTDTQYFPMILAGDPNYDPDGAGPLQPDSPEGRITTAYPATGSLLMQGKTGNYLCTGTLINDPITINGDQATDNRWVLTAGHCLDSNNNGKLSFKPSDVTFFPEGNTSAGIVANQLILHPNFRGFGRGGSVSDDIALIRLSTSASVPATNLHESIVDGGEFRMVGFGLTGDGVNGYNAGSASLVTKREGGNHVDDFGEGSNNSSNKDKIWRADFDHPEDGTYSFLGNQQLAYNVETNLGGGDSGGPSYFGDATGVGGVAAINTFGYSVNNSTHGWIQPPFFGSGMGGILVFPYLEWINGVMIGGGGGGGGEDGDGGGGKPDCHPKRGCSSSLNLMVDHLDAFTGLVGDFVVAGQPTSTSPRRFEANTSTKFDTKAETDTFVSPWHPQVSAATSPDHRNDDGRTPTGRFGSSSDQDATDRLFEAWPENFWSMSEDDLLSV